MAHNIPDLRTLPLDRFCNFVWYWATRDGEQKEIDKFRAKLWLPPKGTEPPKKSPWSPEAEMAAFAAVKQALGK